MIGSHTSEAIPPETHSDEMNSQKELCRAVDAHLGIGTARAGSTATHTPGPWTCTIDDEGFNVFQDDPKHPGNGDHIMCIAGNPESEANARLIAAAPELLAALRDTLESLECHEQDCQRDGLKNAAKAARRQIDAARAAIAKAEGRAI